MTHKKSLFVASFILCSFALGNSTANELKDEETKTHKTEGAGNNSPRLEIKKYRFFHNSKLNNERLVLEFERRNAQGAMPKLTTELTSKQELKLQIENAVLLGAIPESLINDSYAQQSHFLGPITVDDRSMESGLAMAVKLRNPELSYKAEWLMHPDRLVIDVFPKNSPAAKHAAMHTGGERNPSSLHMDRKNPIGAFDRFICFPAKAKVGLAVIFQPSNKKEDEIQKFRVHTDGSALGLYSALDRESIVCYPKQSEVNAMLSFQPIEVIQEGPVTMGTNNASVPQITPPPAVQASAEPMPLPIPPPPTIQDAAAGQRPPPLPPIMGVDSDLDPGNISGH